MSRPSIGVAVFVFRSDTDNHILIGKRKGSHGSGLIAHPGGHLEHGESFEACAEREVMEETGLAIKNIRFLTATTTVLANCDKQYVTIWMTATNAPVSPGSDQTAEPKLLEPEKCEGWSWSTFEDMEKLPDQGCGLFCPVLTLIEQRADECHKLRTGSSALYC